MTESVTIQRATSTTDRYGATVDSWTSPTETEVHGCMFAPKSSTEAHENGRQAEIAGGDLYLPAGTDILATDRVVVRGETHTVHAGPASWKSGYTFPGERGIHVEVRRVVG